MVKIGDLVKFRGENSRILAIDNSHTLLSGFGWIYNTKQSDLEMVEHNPLPQLKDGDLVYIHDIPAREKSVYGPNWVSGMSHYVTTKTDLKIGKMMAYPVTDVRHSNWYGPLVTIEGYTFQTYHLEPVNNYDII